MTDTITYAGREWREAEIWELCGALDAIGFHVEISIDKPPRCSRW